MSRSSTQSGRGFSAPGPSRVMSSRFWTKRLSRSASSWIVSASSRRSAASAGPRRTAGWSPHPGSRPAASADRGRARTAGRRAAAPFSAATFGRFDVGHQLGALDGDGGLVGQRVEQAAVVGRQQGPRPICTPSTPTGRGPSSAAGTARRRPAACRSRVRPAGRATTPIPPPPGLLSSGPPADSRAVTTSRSRSGSRTSDRPSRVEATCRPPPTARRPDRPRRRAAAELVEVLGAAGGSSVASTCGRSRPAQLRGHPPPPPGRRRRSGCPASGCRS